MRRLWPWLLLALLVAACRQQPPADDAPTPPSPVTPTPTAVVWATAAPLRAVPEPAWLPAAHPNQAVDGRYRIELILEGDDASRREAFDTALAAYERAIGDDTLLAWGPAWQLGPAADLLGVTPNAAEERERLTVYAHFRQLVIHAVTGDIRHLMGNYESIRTEFGPDTDSAAYPYVLLTFEFWRIYSKSQAIGVACHRARRYAEVHALEILAPLSDAHYGPLSRPFTGDDICPFRG